MSIGIKRLNVEFANLKKLEEKEKKDGVQSMFRVWQKNGKITHWGAKIRGPKGTPHEDGIYVLDIQFSDKYPYTAPQVAFMCKMFHPNVSSSNSGNGGYSICLDILKSGKWSAALKMEQVLISIISFLSDPNPDDPLNSSVASVLRSNKAEYEKTVQKYRDDYCSKRPWEEDE
jgi:ubiquitin-conjugating enzyme E2 D/E